MRLFKRLLVVSCLMLLPGCAGCQNDMKHLKSNWVGLNRRITLYGSDGTEIRVWETRAKVEDNGGSCWFLNSVGKAVTVSGTFVIEEL